MKNQVLFSSKDKSKKLKCCQLQFLFGTLRLNPIALRTAKTPYRVLAVLSAVGLKKIPANRSVKDRATLQGLEETGGRDRRDIFGNDIREMEIETKF